jgi:O-antigen ligase
MLKVLYYLTLLSLVLGQFANISKSEGTNIYIFDGMVLATAVLSGVYLLAVKRQFKIPAPFLYFFGFIFVGAVSLLINSYKYSLMELISSSFYIVRFVSYTLFALTTYNLVLLNKISKREIYVSIVASGVTLVGLGIAQLILLPDFETLDPSLGWDPHKNRLASTFFDPNFVGAYLVMCSMVVVEKAKKLDLLHVGVLGVLLFGIIFTFSRSAWLMLAVFVLIYGVLKNRKLLFVALLIMFLAYYSVPRIQTRISGTTDPADSAQFRWESWSNTLEIVKDQPVLGVGYNTLRYVQKDYGFTDEDTFLKHSASGSDSSLLFVTATTGIIGLALFLAGAFGIGSDLLYKIMMLSLLVESQFINSLFYPQILFVWMTTLAIGYVKDD